MSGLVAAMMGKQYRFLVSGDCIKKLESMKRTAGEKGIAFEGDCNKGSFWGHGLMCNYFRLGDEVVLNIESVPTDTTFDDMAKLLEKYLAQ